MICELSAEIKESILDVLDEMKKSIFYWDQWKLGSQLHAETTKIGAEQPFGGDNRVTLAEKSPGALDYNHEKNIAFGMDDDVGVNRYLQYQSLNERIPLMVHANPFFKPYGGSEGADADSDFERNRAQKVKRVQEKRAKILGLKKKKGKMAKKGGSGWAQNFNFFGGGSQAGNNPKKPNFARTSQKLRKKGSKGAKNVFQKNVRKIDLASAMASRAFRDETRDYKNQLERAKNQLIGGNDLNLNSDEINQLKSILRSYNSNNPAFQSSESQAKMRSEVRSRPDFQIKKNAIKLYSTDPLSLQRRRGLKSLLKRSNRSAMSDSVELNHRQRAKLLYGLHSNKSSRKSSMRDSGSGGLPRTRSMARNLGVMQTKGRRGYDSSIKFSKALVPYKASQLSAAMAGKLFSLF